MQCASFLNYLIDRRGNGGLLGYVSVEGKYLTRVTVGNGCKIITSFSNVNRVDLCGTVRKTAFRNA
jgi:hypothetical protein